jgi:hypothetical protein
VSTIDDGSLLSVCGSALAQSATTPTSATAAAVFAVAAEPAEAGAVVGELADVGAVVGEATADRTGDTAWTACDAAWLAGEAAVGVASDAAAEPPWPA